MIALDLTVRSDAADDRTVIADVGDESAVNAAISAAVERLAGLDSLICVAGIDVVGTAEETSPADWHRVISVNVTGPYLCVRAALPYLRQGRMPTVVTVGSQFGLIAKDRFVAYCASKAALAHLTRAMAVDHGREGIRINCVVPGPVDTPLNRAYFDSTGDPEGERRKYSDRTLSGRFAESEETARVIAFLASDESTSLYGSIVVADAGYSIH